MSRRRASITQAELSRIIRAAKKARVREICISVGDARVLIRLETPAPIEIPLEEAGEIVL